MGLATILPCLIEILSKGAVAIARGLMARPQVLLLDEPSLGLAPQLVVSLYATLASLCEEGISILLVDQMAQLAFSVAHRVYVLETGKIVRSGTSEELSRDSLIADSYLGNLQSYRLSNSRLTLF